MKRTARVNWKLLLYLLVVTALLTYVLYHYKRSRPPDAARIEHCEARVKQLPESTPQEIDRSISAYLECLRE